MQNSIKILVVGLVFLAAVSWFVLAGKNSLSTSSTLEQFLIPELQSQINEIDEIVLSKNDKTISLSKIDGTWRIQQANGFIADANKVANLLLDLRKFKLKEKKTINPDKYPKLSLAESGENAATSIALFENKTAIANISIGKQAQKSQGTYVRKNDEVQTWLSQGKLTIKLDSNDWIVNTIFDVDVSQVKSVAFKTNDIESFSINKISPQDENFALENMSENMSENMPENHQLKAGYDMNSLANGLQKFNIDSIADVNNTTLLPEDAVLSVTYELFSGLQYQLFFYQKEDNNLMKVKFNNLGSNNQYEQQLTQWVYAIAKYKFDALNKKLSELVEIIPTTEKSQEVQEATE
ncbi:MAG: DUF4340 domain-containing protein [Proteobacteria bacterium]|nr:DUF4340 domain-containing protein [Pseudomonadota bacterium]